MASCSLGASVVLDCLPFDDPQVERLLKSAVS
jgi:hypothetical protein